VATVVQNNLIYTFGLCPSIFTFFSWSLNFLPKLRYLDIEGDSFNQQSTRARLPNLIRTGVEVFKGY